MAKKKRTLRRNTKEDTPVAHIVGTDKIVPIEQVRPNTFNYNKQTDFIFEKMKKSLQEFGFVDPILVRSGNDEGAFEFYEVIGGEHRLKAAERLGYTEVPIRDIGSISDVQAKKLCIVLNETKGRPDNDALSSLIVSISEEVGTDGLEVLPYDDYELDAFMNIGLDDWGAGDDDLGDGLGDEDSGDKKNKKTIMSVMGLLDISKKKEDFLIAQFESVVEVMVMQGKPIRALEKMLSDAIRKYGNS